MIKPNNIYMYKILNLPRLLHLTTTYSKMAAEVATTANLVTKVSIATKSRPLCLTNMMSSNRSPPNIAKGPERLEPYFICTHVNLQQI